jgi:hypothetical protein
MSDFEREIVCCLNRVFKTHHIEGFAYRLRQNKFMNQYGDVLVDSLNPSCHPLIECKSILGRILSFSQHFPVDRNNVNQVDAISNFLTKTGRIGYLHGGVPEGAGKGRRGVPDPVADGNRALCG